jgi:hypothetical protein
MIIERFSTRQNGTFGSVTEELAGDSPIRPGKGDKSILPESRRAGTGCFAQMGLPRFPASVMCDRRGKDRLGSRVCNGRSLPLRRRTPILPFTCREVGPHPRVSSGGVRQKQNSAESAAGRYSELIAPDRDLLADGLRRATLCGPRARLSGRKLAGRTAIQSRGGAEADHKRHARDGDM